MKGYCDRSTQYKAAAQINYNSGGIIKGRGGRNEK